MLTPTGLDRIKEKIQEKTAEIHNKVTETEADFKLKKAESEAKAAEDYAEQVLSLAFYYFDEAEVAAIDAILSRRTVDSLKD
ncbi:hypothetical protein [Undibacterium sp. SXout20W]|uniref:hypothetical protein n=1 Tax=Undibacterium sp. SXout20W TaxID=3413051 RepID=UPI003BF1AED5